MSAALLMIAGLLLYYSLCLILLRGTVQKVAIVVITLSLVFTSAVLVGLALRTTIRGHAD